MCTVLALHPFLPILPLHVSSSRPDADTVKRTTTTHRYRPGSYRPSNGNQTHKGCNCPPGPPGPEGIAQHHTQKVNYGSNNIYMYTPLARRQRIEVYKDVYCRENFT